MKKIIIISLAIIISFSFSCMPEKDNIMTGVLDDAWIDIIDYEADKPILKIGRPEKEMIEAEIKNLRYQFVEDDLLISFMYADDIGASMIILRFYEQGNFNAETMRGYTQSPEDPNKKILTADSMMMYIEGNYYYGLFPRSWNDVESEVAWEYKINPDGTRYLNIDTTEYFLFALLQNGKLLYYFDTELNFDYTFE